MSHLVGVSEPTPSHAAEEPPQRKYRAKRQAQTMKSHVPYSISRASASTARHGTPGRRGQLRDLQHALLSQIDVTPLMYARGDGFMHGRFHVPHGVSALFVWVGMYLCVCVYVCVRRLCYRLWLGSWFMVWRLGWREGSGVLVVLV